MAGPCSAAFQRLARELGGFGCDGANAVLELHGPLGLDHWTMLVIEVATFVGAVLALRHALRRRRGGDPTTLAIWIAAIAYLVVVEPPLYFPDQFGLQDHVGLIFVHNEFTVQFLWNRLPLYIVSIYPAMAVLSYELVRATGVFDRRGPLVSAVTVGFVHHVFYEVFDHVGPQLRWWIWNPAAPTNEPMLASVPISSMVTFAVAGPVALTWLVRVLVARHPTAAAMPTRSLLGRGLLAGVLMPLGLVVGGLPATVFALGAEPNRTGQAVAMWGVLGLVAAVAVAAVADALRSGRPDADAGTRRYLATHAAVHLGALVVAWGAAVPGYLGATGGVTADGTPIGHLPYALACLALSGVVVVFATGRRAVTPPRGPSGPGTERPSEVRSASSGRPAATARP